MRKDAYRYIAGVVGMIALLCAVLSFTGEAHAASTKQRHYAVNYAKSKVGQWYRWGGVGPVGFDCSGLPYAAYRNVGVNIPRTTFGQLAGLRIKENRRPGDLVFSGRGHVAMYIGHGRVVEAPSSGKRIRIASSARFNYARRSP